MVPAVKYQLLTGTRLRFVPTDREGNMNKCLTSSFQAVWGKDLVISDSGLLMAKAVLCLCLVQQEHDAGAQAEVWSNLPLAQ